MDRLQSNTTAMVSNAPELTKSILIFRQDMSVSKIVWSQLIDCVKDVVIPLSRLTNLKLLFVLQPRSSNPHTVIHLDHFPGPQIDHLVDVSL